MNQRTRIKHVFGCLTVSLLVTCLAAQGSLAGTLRTREPVYAPDQSIVVEFSGFPGNKGDWITVVQASARPDSYAEWDYTGGKSSGSLTFKGLSAGSYEVRGYYNWPAGGYTVQARHAFTVGESSEEHSAVLRTNKQEYNPNEEVVVDFSGFPGTKGDWITIVPAYYPVGKYAEWHYTDGKASGQMTFRGLQEGEYEVRAYFDWPKGLYVVKGRRAFKVRN
jgi:hypothetical protein